MLTAYPIRLFYLPVWPGQCSKSSRTTCTLRFLRAVHVQTACNNYAHWDRALSLVNMRHIFNDYCPDGCGWQGCHVWHCWVACRVTIKPLIDTPAEEKIPVYQLADYLSTECSDIWALQGKSTETNPLYWLRAMDCADRLMPAQSRQQARQYDDGNWQNTF